jgi:hypothetical protein
MNQKERIEENDDRTVDLEKFMDRPGARERLIALLANDCWPDSFVRACFDKYDSVQRALTAPHPEASDRDGTSISFLLSLRSALAVGEYNPITDPSFHYAEIDNGKAIPIVKDFESTICVDERRKAERFEKVLRFLHDEGPTPEGFSDDDHDCYEYAVSLMTADDDSLEDDDPRWFEGWLQMIEAAMKRRAILGEGPTP